MRAPRKTRENKGTTGTSAGSVSFSEKHHKAVIGKVWQVAEPLCESEGLELVHVEYQREPGGRTLRIFIDRPGGIRLDDCVDISRQLSDLLDVYLEQEAAYHLEVSSPGPERPLCKKEDFNRFKGKAASIRTVQPIEGRKNFKGILLGLGEEKVLLDMNGTIVEIPLHQVKKARLVNHHGE